MRQSKLESYKLIHQIKDQETSSFNVGLYKNALGESVLIKSSQSNPGNNYYRLLQNEANLYRLISAGSSKIKKTEVTFPKLISLLEKDDSITLVREYLAGTKIKNLPSNVKLVHFNTALETLKKITLRLTKKDSACIPKRKPWQLFLVFPFYTLRAILRDKSHSLLFMKMFFLFYFHHISLNVLTPKYELAHRDLTTDNILKNKNQLSIIDIETMMLCEEDTDVALFPRFYFRELPLDEIIRYLRNKLYTNGKIRRFYRISIFYAIHFLSLDRKGTEYYDEALSFLQLLNTRFMPEIKTRKKSIAEYVLMLILFTLKLLKPFMKSKKIQSHILCFHGVGSDNWRFTQTPTEFEDQITFLVNKGIRIVPLKNLLEQRKDLTNTIAITFDDGYEDMITEVLPITKRLGIQPTLFAIGKPEKANQSELDNNKKLLTIMELNKLHEKGWEIGFHSATHADLSKLSRNQLEREITIGKQELEHTLNISIPYFAYPRGFYSDKITNLVASSGFKNAFTIDGGPVKNTGDDFNIPRFSLERGLSTEELYLLLTPIGAWLYRMYISTLKTKQALINKFN